jgi:hypothetical protein
MLWLSLIALQLACMVGCARTWRAYQRINGAEVTRKETLFGLAIGSLGPIGPAVIAVHIWPEVRRKRRELAAKANEEQKLLTGPTDQDDLGACLKLKNEIADEIERCQTELAEKQALIQEAQRFCSQPITDESATELQQWLKDGESLFDAVQQACDRTSDLGLRLGELREAADNTEARLQGLHFVCQATLEAHEEFGERSPALLEAAANAVATSAAAHDTTVTEPPLAGPSPELARRLQQNAASKWRALEEIAICWFAENLMGLLGKPFTSVSRRCYTEGNIRTWLAEWIQSYYGDTALALAISRTPSPQAASALIRRRLEQAIAIAPPTPPSSTVVAAEPKLTTTGNAQEVLKRLGIPSPALCQRIAQDHDKLVNGSKELPTGNETLRWFRVSSVIVLTNGWLQKCTEDMYLCFRASICTWLAHIVGDLRASQLIAGIDKPDQARLVLELRLQQVAELDQSSYLPEPDVSSTNPAEPNDRLVTKVPTDNETAAEPVAPEAQNQKTATPDATPDPV